MKKGDNLRLVFQNMFLINPWSKWKTKMRTYFYNCFLIRFIVFQEIWWDNNVEISCRQINKGWYTAQIYDGTTTLPQQKCHILDITTLNCSNFEGKTLAVQYSGGQRMNDQRAARFNIQPSLWQIVVNCNLKQLQPYNGFHNTNCNLQRH